VRLVAPEPEIELATAGALLHELVEVLELWARWIPAAAGRLGPAGPPALAGVSHHVSGLLEEVGIDGKSFRKEAMQVAAFFQAVYGLTGQERRARRRARRRSRERVGEPGALPRDPIEHGRADRPIPLDARVRGRPVVGDGEHECWVASLRPADRPLARADWPRRCR